MPFIKLHEIEEREPVSGYKVRFIHSAHMTFAYWTITAGAVLPSHAHPHEQVANVIEGQLELTVGGEARPLGAGSVAIIPSNVVHSARALTECHVIDVFYPIREDYR